MNKSSEELPGPAEAGLDGPVIARGRCGEIVDLGGDRVLKRFYAHLPVEWAGVEYERTRLASEVCALAPHPLQLHEVGDRHGIVLPRLEGPSLLADLLRKPWHAARVGRRLASLHAEIHACPGQGLPSVRDSLADAIRRSSLDEPLRARALAELARCGDGLALCHMDFHPDQVMQTPRGDVVIDWATAGRGHPLADVTRTWLMLRLGEPPGAGLGLRLFIAVLRRGLIGAYLRRYGELRGIDAKVAIRPWIFPVAAARLSDGIAEERPRLLRLLARVQD
ncbi:aminoglycoside phosphotransferase family protein [Niveibacterium sp. SC-1]|uniref:phosphotransferase family protein n=1 Tax=Niveibacterium sp. SC-1 TaxID=3135646 RepID=UPI00311DB0A8